VSVFGDGRISSGVTFQMTGTVEWKEREPKDGVGSL